MSKFLNIVELISTSISKLLVQLQYSKKSMHVVFYFFKKYIGMIGIN